MFPEIIIFLLSMIFFFLCDLLMIKFVSKAVTYYLENDDCKNQRNNSNAFKDQPSNNSLILKFWRLRNLLMSIINAIVTGFMSFYILLQEPNLLNDMMLECVAASYIVAFAIGYFVHDSYHMLVGDPSRNTKELLIHHFIGIFCMIYVVYTGTYLGITLVGLLVELNSIFLHTRALLLMFKVRRFSSVYIIVANLNLVSFVVFRLCVMGWQLKWIVFNLNTITLMPFILLFLSIPLMTFMNVVLFYRVAKSDLMQWFPLQWSPHNNNTEYRNNGLPRSNGLPTGSHLEMKECQN